MKRRGAGPQLGAERFFLPRRQLLAQAVPAAAIGRAQRRRLRGRDLRQQRRPGIEAAGFGIKSKPRRRRGSKWSTQNHVKNPMKPTMLQGFYEIVVIPEECFKN